MNEHAIWLMAEEHRRDLLEEARQERLLKEAGIRVSLPAGLKALGLALVSLPFAVLLVRAWLKL